MKQMMLDALLAERKELRQAAIVYQQAIHKCMFLMITLFIAVGGIYWDTRILPDKTARSQVLFLLSQIEVMLVLFTICAMSCTMAHSSYIKIIEDRINTLCGRTVNVWESEVSSKYVVHPRGAFFWTIVANVIAYLAFFIFFLKVAFEEIDSFWYGFLITLEIIIMLALLGFSYFDRQRIPKNLRQVLGQMDAIDERSP